MGDAQSDSKTFFIRWRRVAGHWFYGLVVAFLAFFAGLFGSTQSDQIGRAFPFCGDGPPIYCWIVDYPLETEANLTSIAFWVTALVWLTLFVGRQAAESHATRALQSESRKLGSRVDRIRKSTSRLESITKRVEDSVQTLPPRSFRVELRRTSRKMHQLVNSWRPRVRGEADELAPNIRPLLRRLANLAARYDDNDMNRDRYGAYVMLLAEVPQELTELDLGLMNENLGRDDLFGVLLRDPELCATGGSEIGSTPVDERLQGQLLQFPLPKQEYLKNDGKWAIPPVAPIAFSTGESYWWPDTTDMGILEQGFALTPRVIRKLRELHLAGTDNEKSILALPLRMPITEKDAIRVGTVNIYRAEPNMLRGSDDRMDTFAAVIAPAINIIAEACYSPPE